MTIERYIPKEGEYSLKCYVAKQGNKVAFGHNIGNALSNLCLQLRTLRDYQIKELTK